MLVRRFLAGAVAKMQELAFRTIDLGRQARRFVDRKMPLLRRAVTATFFRVNTFLRNKYGRDLTVIIDWGNATRQYIVAQSPIWLAWSLFYFKRTRVNAVRFSRWVTRGHFPPAEDPIEQLLEATKDHITERTQTRIIDQSQYTVMATRAELRASSSPVAKAAWDALTKAETLSILGIYAALNYKRQCDEESEECDTATLALNQELTEYFEKLTKVLGADSYLAEWMGEKQDLNSMPQQKKLDIIISKMIKEYG